MFWFEKEGFRGIMKGMGSFGGVFFSSSDAHELLEPGEGLLGISITVGEQDTRVLDFQLMLGLVRSKNGIPRITDSIPIGVMRNISRCLVPVMSCSSII